MNSYDRKLKSLATTLETILGEAARATDLLEQDLELVEQRIAREVRSKLKACQKGGARLMLTIGEDTPLAFEFLDDATGECRFVSVEGGAADRQTLKYFGLSVDDGMRIVGEYRETLESLGKLRDAIFFAKDVFEMEVSKGLNG